MRCKGELTRTSSGNNGITISRYFFQQRKGKFLELSIGSNSTCGSTRASSITGCSCVHSVSKNDTGVAHYNFNAHQPISVFLAQMLPRECAIKWWFVIPPLLTNVSALPAGETWTPKLCLFSHALYRVSIMTLLPEHAIDFVFFSDEQVFTVASPVNLQNDRAQQCEVARHRSWTPAALSASMTEKT